MLAFPKEGSRGNIHWVVVSVRGNQWANRSDVLVTNRFGSQTDLISVLGLNYLIYLVSLEKLFIFFGPQFPYL